MFTYRFRTSINCIACVTQLRPVMQEIDEIEEWRIDLTDPSYILTVETASLSAEEVAALVRNAGFEAELLNG